MHTKRLINLLWLLCMQAAVICADVPPTGLSTCCPPNWQLARVAGLPHHYECRPQSTTSLAEQTTHVPGYNIHFPGVGSVGIPMCLAPAYLQLSQIELSAGLQTLDASNTCLTHFEGQLSVLRCSARPTDRPSYPVEVHRLQKCCPAGFIYDLTERQCQWSALDADIPGDAYAHLAANPTEVLLLSRVQTPVCQDESEVFVEYLSAGHRLSLRAGGVEVVSRRHGEAELLPAGTFCVEVATALPKVEDTELEAMATTTMQDDDDEQTTTEEYVVADGDEEMVANTQPPPIAQLIIRTCRQRSICKRIACVRRCCRNEQMMERQNGTSVCVPHERNIRPMFYDVQWPLVADRPPAPADVAEYGLIHLQTCKRYILDASYPEDVHYINRDGRLHVVALPNPFGQNDYCVEYVNHSDVIQMETFVCFQEYSQAKFLYYPIGLTISTLFLWVTLIVYISLPKLLNLHGKTLVCHVCSLLIAYTALAIVQFHSDIKMESCYIMAYVIYFGFVASFCWQSIMCFDIWWTFGSMRMSRGMQKHKELRRFLLYSLYAWGVPILLTNATIQFDLNDWFGYEWSPNMIQENRCWFQNDEDVRYALPVFFLIPIGAHIVTNTVLFGLTFHHCNKVKNEIHRMQAASDELDTQRAKKRFAADRAKYMMNVKLFCVMGVSWLLEVVGTVFRQNSVVWYFTDTFNILQGVLVFLIFVFKWKVWHELQLRLGLRKPQNKGTTNATATTQLSTSTGRLSQAGPYGRMVSKSVSTSTLASSNVNLSAIRRD